MKSQPTKQALAGKPGNRRSFFLILIAFTLLGCGGQGGDTDSLLSGSGPGTVAHVTVQSTVSWQDSGVIVSPGQVVRVSAQGTWTPNPAYGMVGPSGGLRVARVHYSLPGEREGALVGRVGSHVFLIGSHAVIPYGLSGRLELVINDDLLAVYGLGLKDNHGSLLVSITTN